MREAAIAPTFESWQSAARALLSALGGDLELAESPGGGFGIRACFGPAES